MGDMDCLLYVLIMSNVLPVTQTRIYPYVSRYNWKSVIKPPPLSYNNDGVPSPCSGSVSTPCPPPTDASTPPTTSTGTTTTSADGGNTTTFSAASSTTTQVPLSSTMPSTTTETLPDCITEGGGICTAACNIGTFTQPNSGYSCHGNGVGSVCCLER